MDITLEGIVIIVGDFGSGKTEVAINLAVYRRQAGCDVRIADLDLVNPYFRTREARRQLTGCGIGVAIPPEKYLQADLPILIPEIGGLIRQPAQLTILDVGGGEAGATVLAALYDALRHHEVTMLQVINPFRPYTSTVEGCRKVQRRIEAAAKAPITGFIGNANLMEETTVEDIYSGHDFVRRLADESGLSLAFITADVRLRPRIDAGRLSCPLLPITRQLVPPWKKAAAFGASAPRGARLQTGGV